MKDKPKKFTFIAKVIVSNRITVPHEVVEQWDLNEGDWLKVTVEKVKT
jgi:bifunctional DNA-binding transcriptional regulator/antitoxin component of YhaV-PrlF toxin-antitoxin module